MEKKTLYLIYVIIVLPFAVACRDTEDNLTVSTLRSDIHDYLYTINNSEATQRLDSIMYNKTDTDKIYERFKIVHISDPHISAISTNNNYTNPINLKQSVTFANQSKLKINALIATGDFISNSSRKDAILFMESFTKHFYEGNHIPSFICTGNHDCNMIEKVSKNYISKEKIHSILFPKQTQTNQNYFYADIPNPQGGTIRIISLDMLDQPGTEYNTRIYAYYSQEQINWLPSPQFACFILCGGTVLDAGRAVVLYCGQNLSGRNIHTELRKQRCIKISSLIWAVSWWISTPRPTW